MKDTTSGKHIKTAKSYLFEMVSHVLSGKTSLAKESFDKALHAKAASLTRQEKTRMANVIFSESYLPRSEASAKEDEVDSKEIMYNQLVVRDHDLYEREKNHMPEWMQDSDADGTEIDPIKERDAINLTSKFHSVEFTTDT